jgi:hypothetical protein
VGMGMVLEFPIPGVEDAEGPDLGAETPRIAGDPSPAARTHSPLRVGRFLHAAGPLQHLDEEESQSSDSLMDRAVGELPVAEQVSSVFADVCRAELVGRTVKMAREILNDSEINAPGRIGEITTLEETPQASAFVDGSQRPPCDRNVSRLIRCCSRRSMPMDLHAQASAASASFMHSYR